MTTLTDAMCRLQYASRFPTMAEYKAGSPADQRAIIARWLEISRTAGEDGTKAWYLWHRAVIGCFHENDPILGTHYVQGDYNMVDSRKEYEHGE